MTNGYSLWLSLMAMANHHQMAISHTPSAMVRAKLLHRALHQLLRIVELFEHERDVQLWLTRKAVAAAVDAVLADQCQRIGEEVERHGQAAPRGAHHRLVQLEGVAMLVKDRHKLSTQRTGRTQS